MDLADAHARAGARRLHEQRVARASATRWRTPSGSRYHSRAVTVTRRQHRQPGGAQHDLRVGLVHTDRAGEHAGADVADAGHLEHPLDRAVLAPRPVQEREHHVDLAERLRWLRRPRARPGRRRRPRAVARSRRGRRRPRQLRPAPVIRSRSVSPDSSTQRPSGAIPIGTTSYADRSMASSTLPAVTQLIACSLGAAAEDDRDAGLARSGL